MGNDVFAVKDVCIFSRHNPPRCYSELAGVEVPYDPEIAKRILLPNVPLDCFLQFKFTPSSNVHLAHPTIHKLEYRVHSIEQVNPDRFGLIFKTPWLNLAQPVYANHDPFEVEKNPEKEKNLPGIKAFALVGKKVYIPSKPQWRVFLALDKMNSLLKIKDTSIKPHAPLLIDVRFSHELNRFIVYDATLRSGPEFPATLTVDGFHKAPLVPFEGCPGYFKFRDIGLVFDKYGQMATHYSDDGQKEIICDFTYADPDERAYTPLCVHKVYGETEVDLTQLKYTGIFIGNNEFFCPDLHFYILRAPHGKKFDIGASYEITIEKIHRSEAIADVDAILIPEYEPVPHKQVNDNYEYLFQITVLHFANNGIVYAPTLGTAIGATENEIARCESGMSAVGVQFPLPEELPEDRPQLRPKISRTFKNYEAGKSIAGYK